MLFRRFGKRIGYFLLTICVGFLSLALGITLAKIVFEFVSAFISGFPSNIARNSSWPIYIFDWLGGIVFGFIFGLTLLLFMAIGIFGGLAIVWGGMMDLIGFDTEKYNLKWFLSLIKRLRKKE